MNIRRLLFITAVCTGLSLPLSAKDLDESGDISAIITLLKKAIEQKDKDGFLSLFATGDVSWYGVISKETIEALVAKDPRFAKQPKVVPGTPTEFIDSIVNRQVPTRETTENVEITQDDDVASVTFDYQFYEDNRLRNYGKENWQLINTPDGWKINAVNFSMTMNPDVLKAQ